jgi:hypothetical protein
MGIDGPRDVPAIPDEPDEPRPLWDGSENMLDPCRRAYEIGAGLGTAEVVEQMAEADEGRMTSPGVDERLAGRRPERLKPEPPRNAVRFDLWVHGIDARSRQFSLAEDEIKEFWTETAKNLCMGIAKLAADAHGLGVALWTVECMAKAVEWSQTARDMRGLEVGVSLPFGPGDLEVSAHLGGDGPRVTFCAGIAGESPVGVLVIDEATVGPGDKRVEAQEARPNLAVIKRRALELPNGEIPEMVDALTRYANNEGLLVMLRSALRKKRSDLAETSDLVLWHMLVKFGIGLFYRDDAAEPSWWVVIQEEDDRKFRLRMGRVSL